MIKVDYISTKDMNRVAKIHSNKKYINWTMKIVNDEYRFYPPLSIVIDEDVETDDFDFTKDNDDTIEIDNLLNNNKTKVNSMIGEIWSDTTTFLTDFANNKFNLINYIDDSKMTKRIKNIKKGMNHSVNLDKFMDKTIVVKYSSPKIRIERFIKFINNDDSYKMYRLDHSGYQTLKLDKYKKEIFDEDDLRDKLEDAKQVVDKHISFLKKKIDNIEILSLDEKYN